MFLSLLPPRATSTDALDASTPVLLLAKRVHDSSALPPASEGWRNIKLIACLLDAKRGRSKPPKKEGPLIRQKSQSQYRAINRILRM